MYRLRNGFEFDRGFLNSLEWCELSEEEIARWIGISRMMLFKIRKKMGWPQLERSDKGKLRSDPVESKSKRLKYMREYRIKNPDKFAYSRNSKVGKVVKQLGRPLHRWEVICDHYENKVICTQDYHLNVLHGYKALELRDR